MSIINQRRFCWSVLDKQWIPILIHAISFDRTLYEPIWWHIWQTKEADGVLHYERLSTQQPSTKLNFNQARWRCRRVSKIHKQINLFNAYFGGIWEICLGYIIDEGNWKQLYNQMWWLAKLCLLISQWGAYDNGKVSSFFEFILKTTNESVSFDSPWKPCNVSIY